MQDLLSKNMTIVRTNRTEIKTLMNTYIDVSIADFVISPSYIVLNACL